MRGKFKKIAVKAQTLNTHKNTFTKAFIVKDKSEEIDVKKLNARDADTHHPQEHPQEQVRRGVHRERQV